MGAMDSIAQIATAVNGAFTDTGSTVTKKGVETGGPVALSGDVLPTLQDVADTRKDVKDNININSTDTNNHFDIPETQQYKYNWFQQHNPDTYYNKNLAQGSSDYNVNRMSAKRTQQLSRMADMLNNRTYRSAGAASVMSALKGGGVAGPDFKAQERYKFDPIATEETRQMERLREYESTIREAMISRQQGSLDVNYIHEAAKLAQELERAGSISKQELDRMLAYFNEVLAYSQNYRESIFGRSDSVFKTNLDKLRLPDAQYKMILKAWEQNPTNSNILSTIIMGQGTPDILQKTLNDMLYYEVQKAEALGRRADGTQDYSISTPALLSGINNGTASIMQRLSTGGIDSIQAAGVGLRKGLTNGK